MNDQFEERERSQRPMKAQSQDEIKATWERRNQLMRTPVYNIDQPGLHNTNIHDPEIQHEGPRSNPYGRQKGPTPEQIKTEIQKRLKNGTASSQLMEINAPEIVKDNVSQESLKAIDKEMQEYREFIAWKNRRVLNDADNNTDTSGFIEISPDDDDGVLKKYISEDEFIISPDVLETLEVEEPKIEGNWTSYVQKCINQGKVTFEEMEILQETWEKKINRKDLEKYLKHDGWRKAMEVLGTTYVREDNCSDK